MDEKQGYGYELRLEARNIKHVHDLEEGVELVATDTALIFQSNDEPDRPVTHEVIAADVGEVTTVGELRNLAGRDDFHNDEHALVFCDLYGGRYHIYEAYTQVGVEDTSFRQLVFLLVEEPRDLGADDVKSSRDKWLASEHAAADERFDDDDEEGKREVTPGA